MRRRSVFQSAILLAGIGLFLCFPDRAREGVRAGLSLCGSVLVPALFPVSVLSGCLIRTRSSPGNGAWAERWMQALFGLPGAGALPLLLGMLGGFPLGAQLAATAFETGQLTKDEAARLGGLSNNAGPAFLLGAAGTILGSPALGGLLFGIQLIACIITGHLFRRPTKRPAAVKRKSSDCFLSLGSVLPRCMGESAVAMLRLTGAVVFFQALTACLGAILPLSALPSLCQAAISATLELTGGLALLKSEQAFAVLPLAAALIGWGGFCVHLQAADAMKQAGLPVGPYLWHKAAQAGVSVLLALFFRGLRSASVSVSCIGAGIGLCALLFFPIFQKIRLKLASSVL